MFPPTMLAPCGLNCGLCSEALKKENPCAGCLGDNENKPEFCSMRCKIAACRLRKELADGFCDSCAQYPCEEMLEREHRYTTAYPMAESPMDNLRRMRCEGTEKFLASEWKKWTCGECGGVICVHTGVCSRCGRLYHKN